MPFPDQPSVILASASKSRAALLGGAGLDFEIVPADVDEPAVRATLESGNDVLPEDVAAVLARTKAQVVSQQNSERHVIGADQVLALGGKIFEKPSDMKAARKTLLELAGQTHQLHAAVAVARGGETVWAHTETAHMTMRSLDPAYIGQYLAAAGDAVLSSVGAYQLESLGVHLFSEIRGDYFTILGLPLLPLLHFLRSENEAPR